MSEDQIREVGKALLPYLRNDLTDVELGTACHDAVAALNRVAGIDRLRERLSAAMELAERCHLEQATQLKAETERLREDRQYQYDCCQKAYAELDRLRAELAKWQWQPIETAPKNGYLIGYCPDESMTPKACIIVVWWEEKLKRWHSDFACDEGGVRPTHWMPLPDPPKETEE